MSETSPLTEVLQRVHAPSAEEELRDTQTEFVPILKQGQNGRIGRVKGVPKDPNRIRANWEFNEARDGPVHDAMHENKQCLHNSPRPPVLLKTEQPEHRFLVFLYAQGLSTKEIFLQLGGAWDSNTNLPVSGTGARYSYAHLCSIRRQAWFQTNLVKYMDECGKDAIRAKFEMELKPSIEKVIAIRDDLKAPLQLQLRAAESLIDRFLGKPVQQVVALPQSSVAKYEQDAASLARETEAVEVELKNLNAAF
jgi:hypothetical protein